MSESGAATESLIAKAGSWKGGARQFRASLFCRSFSSWFLRHFYRSQFNRLGDHSVLATELPQLSGQYDFRYVLNVYDAMGKFVTGVELESDLT